MFRQPASPARNVVLVFAASMLLLPRTQAIEEPDAQGLFPSDTTISSSVPSTFVGQPVTFTANVNSPNGPIPDGETVVFYQSHFLTEIEIGTGITAGGVATFTTSALPAGDHTIAARYGGDATFKPSHGTLKQLVSRYATTTTLQAENIQQPDGGSVCLVATVTSNGGPTPTGELFINKIGTLTLNGGIARGCTGSLNNGLKFFKAAYRGDAANKRSWSTTLKIRIG
jgi:hypothetical protein